MQLKGRTILVTGGARRIGAAIVRAVASAGANVVIHCNKSRTEAEALAEVIRAAGVGAWVVEADLAGPGAGDRLFKAALAAAGGRLDGVVNSASEYLESTVDTMTVADIERECRIHVAAPLELVRRLASMPGGDAKTAVNILDARLGAGDPAHAAYMLAKQSLAALTKTLALEYAPRTRVNAVAPGAVLQAPGAPEAELKRLADFNPLKAVGNPAGLAECVLFLLRADFVTGQTLFYDGGYHLRH